MWYHEIEDRIGILVEGGGEYYHLKLGTHGEKGGEGGGRAHT
jgi:hypothetical protein